MAKKTGIQAIEQWKAGIDLKGLPVDKMQQVMYGIYLFTRDLGWYPGDWPKNADLLSAVDKIPIIERVAYVGALMAIEYERLRDQGGFAVPNKGI